MASNLEVSLLLVAMPFIPSRSLLLAAMPGATSSDALAPNSNGLQPNGVLQWRGKKRYVLCPRH